MKKISQDLDNLQLSDEWYKTAINLVDGGFLPQLNNIEDRPLTKADFQSGIGERTDILNKIHTLLIEHKISPDHDITRKKILAPLILLCGENVQSCAWTNSQIIQSSYSILTVLKNQIFKLDSLSSIFEENPELLRICVRNLHLKLTKEDWKKYPAAQQCSGWLLRQISGRFLSEFLADFLPFSLRFIDDWQLTHKIFALQNISYIIENVTKKDLSKFGYTQVLKEALFHVTVHREMDLLRVAFDCTFKFLIKTSDEKNFAKFDIWDEFCQKLLQNMETETKPELKHLYSAQVKKLLPFLGVGTARWISTLLSIISNYAQLNNDVMDALEILSIILEVCAERVKFHSDVIYEMLVRLLYDPFCDGKVFELSSELLRKMALISSQDFLLEFKGFEEEQQQCDADRVVGEILTGLLKRESDP